MNSVTTIGFSFTDLEMSFSISFQLSSILCNVDFSNELNLDNMDHLEKFDKNG